MKLKMRAEDKWGSVPRCLESLWVVEAWDDSEEPRAPEVLVDFCGGARIADMNRMVADELRRTEKCDAIGFSC